jgi:hypothetical protein
MKNFSYFIIISIIFTAFTSNLFAAGGQSYKQMKPSGASKSQPSQMQQNTTGAKTGQTAQEKREQFEKEATDAIPDIDAENAKVLSWVNSNQIPDDANRNAALKNVARNRKFLPVLNKQQKGDTYYTLSAWVYYFDDKPDKALKQAVAGQKLTPQNPNIVKTCLALSMIYKDYAVAAEAFANKGELSQSADESESAAPSTKHNKFASYSQSSISNIELNLDVNSIRPELLGKVFDVRPQAAKPTEKNILCVFLWKIDSNELDRFSTADTNEPNAPSKELNAPASSAAANPKSSSGKKSSSLKNSQLNDSQQGPISPFEAFSNLQNHFAKDSKAVFMGINLNEPNKANNVKNWLRKNPQVWETSMPSADLQRKTTSLFASSPAKQTLMVIGPDSTIRYTGDVNCFLPQMIIQQILANPQEFQEPNKPKDVNQPSAAPKSSAVIVPVKVSPLPQEPNKVHQPQPPAVKEANVIPKPSQAAPAVKAAPAVAANQQQEGDFTADDYEAQKLLANASAFLKIGSRLPNHMYRDPIEWCRTVMKNYPNTKYVQQAQMLLRNVPQEYRQQYNLTDQELGL